MHRAIGREQAAVTLTLLQLVVSERITVVLNFRRTQKQHQPLVTRQHHSRSTPCIADTQTRMGCTPASDRPAQTDWLSCYSATTTRRMLIYRALPDMAQLR